MKLLSWLFSRLIDSPGTRVEWTLVTVVFDGIDRADVDVPLNEAIGFIEANSRFKIENTVLETDMEHTYCDWTLASGQVVWAMLREEIPLELRQSLPYAQSYLFLYKMNGKVHIQAGSTMGVDAGILNNGKYRPYSTVPTDVREYVHTPSGGFKRNSAAILAHEIINGINCVAEAAPHNCPPMVGAVSPDPVVTEGNRLKALGDACYEKLKGAN